MARALAGEAAVFIELLPGGVRLEVPAGTDAQWLSGLLRAMGRVRCSNRTTRVFLKLGATDLQLWFDGLYGQVVTILKQDVLSGHVFGFCNRARTKVKLLMFDGSELWVCAKRLERGRGIRPTKLGAKNWLYIRHPDAGWRSAVICSIIGTCKLLKVDPADYLTWVLPRLAITSAQIGGLFCSTTTRFPSPPPDSSTTPTKPLITPVPCSR